jgi:Methyltransferase domain
MDYESLIEQLDPSIFVLDSQTSTNDRISLLRLQRLIRRRDDTYCYLEIGSHLGGSLLPHLADPRCAWAISVDPRPGAQPDERGGSPFIYEGNSTRRMIECLSKHLPEETLQKLQTFDSDAAAVQRSEVQRNVQLALIDGEHTNVAAFSDFLSIFPFLAEDAVVACHDADLVTDSIYNAERFLTYSGIPFKSLFLPDCVAAIGLRAMGEALLAEVGGACLDRESVRGNRPSTAPGLSSEGCPESQRSGLGDYPEAGRTSVSPEATGASIPISY